MLLERLGPALAAGVLATLNPCVLPLYPGYLAYLAGAPAGRSGPGRPARLGLSVLAGMLAAMLALGATLATAGQALAGARSLASLAGDVIIVILGVRLLLPERPLARLPQLAAPAIPGRPYASAALYGLLYAPVTLPCTGSLIVSMFSLALGLGEFVEQLAFFLLFGLGMGLPLLVLSLLAGAQQARCLRLLTRHAAVIRRAGGLLLIATGAWNFWLGWAFLGG